ncbi:MAG: hypothetical protein ACYDBB_17845 [Armatimonadota bacterium]
MRTPDYDLPDLEMMNDTLLADVMELSDDDLDGAELDFDEEYDPEDPLDTPVQYLRPWEQLGMHNRD